MIAKKNQDIKMIRIIFIYQNSIITIIIWRKVLFVYYFSPYSTIFQLHDGGQFLLVEENPDRLHNAFWVETTNLLQAN
jgi:hypothetical protein